MNGADLLVAALENEGVKQIFGGARHRRDHGLQRQPRRDRGAGPLALRPDAAVVQAADGRILGVAIRDAEPL
jgi:thiamine pyrophosphate-dependent acetolactate synthase large subunit-like protein